VEKVPAIYLRLRKEKGCRLQKTDKDAALSMAFKKERMKKILK
jgi:hypothetical protein